MKVCIDHGHGGYTCLHCGKSFSPTRTQIKRGTGKFCSISCSVTSRNILNNPAKLPEVRVKISANHANVSGENNPMYGRRGRDAPSFIDGRRNYGGDVYRGIALANKPAICEVCGIRPKGKRLHIHHVDKDHSNNDLYNLMVVCVICHNNILHKRERDNKGRFMKVEVMANV